MKEVYDKFGLDGNTADFTGHAFALQFDDRYLVNCVALRN